jgi:hypothetical protein
MHAYPGAGGPAGHFVLVREAPQREQISAIDLVQVRNLHGDSHSPQLHIRLSPEAASHRALLMKGSPGRQLVLVLDAEVLLTQDISSTTEYPYFLPVFESPQIAEDIRALLTSPLPDGARVEVADEITFPR